MGHIQRYKKLSCEYWFYTLQKSEVRAAKNPGKKFRSELVASFSEIVINQSIKNDRVEIARK